MAQGRTVIASSHHMLQGVHILGPFLSPLMDVRALLLKGNPLKVEGLTLPQAARHSPSSHPARSVFCTGVALVVILIHTSLRRWLTPAEKLNS